MEINYSANLKAVDMAGLTGLKTFNCICSYGTPNQKLEALDFSDSGELEVLICSNTRRLSHINLEGLSKLTWLDLYGTLLTSLDVSALADLQILTCMESQLSKLILGKHDKLENLSCQDNNLADLDLRYVPNLKTLDCGSNSDAFVYLDVSHLDNLEVLDCSPGFLKRLDLNKAAPYSSSGVGGVNVTLNVMESKDSITVNGQRVDWNQLGGVRLFFDPQRYSVQADPEMREAYTGTGSRQFVFADEGVGVVESFLRLRHEGKKVPPSCYEIEELGEKESGVVITLKEPYLKTLEPEKAHQFVAEWSHCYSYFGFEAKSPGPEQTSTTPATTSPVTSTVAPTSHVVSTVAPVSPEAGTAPGSVQDPDIDVAVGEPYNFWPLILMTLALLTGAAVAGMRSRKADEGE